jgi:hypothetical protein
MDLTHVSGRAIFSKNFFLFIFAFRFFPRSMFAFVFLIALVLTAFAQDLPPSFSLCYMDSPIAKVNLSITPFPIQAGQNVTVLLDLSLSTQITSDAHIDLSASIAEAQVKDSFPLECGDACGPGNISHESTFPVPGYFQTASINVTVRAFNGVGEVDGIFCIQGMLDIVGV